MLQSEFIHRYCERSQCEERTLNDAGLFCLPCDCGAELCEGWAMVSRESMKDHFKLYIQ